MKNKFEFGIEISENVSRTEVPHKIKRYDNVPKKVVKEGRTVKSDFYRYRPGANGFIAEDFDV